jgi:hypothetical protein
LLPEVQGPGGHSRRVRVLGSRRSLLIVQEFEAAQTLPTGDVWDLSPPNTALRDTLIYVCEETGTTPIQ